MKKLKILIIDGQNNHAWAETSPLLKAILEGSGRYEVTVSTTPPSDGRPIDFEAPQPAVEELDADYQEKWKLWNPSFINFDAVLLNYNGVVWPKAVRDSFETYVLDGGGFICFHAANNAFANWKEYNEMIGVGGWFGRDEKDGPAVHWENGELVKDNRPGLAGHHGEPGPVLVELVDRNHPITRGLPEKWLHPSDEVYCHMRGPAQNMRVLGIAHSPSETGGSGMHHPIQLAIKYGSGRIYHEMLGHDIGALNGVGFQEMLLRGTEWAATGEVTFPRLSEPKLSSLEVTTRAPEDIR